MLDEARAAAGRRRRHPTCGLQALRGAGDVPPPNLGPETVRGVETDHYRAMVDRRRRWSRYRPVPRAQVPASGLETALKVSLPIDVWIDGDGLARRCRDEHRLPRREIGRW